MNQPPEFSEYLDPFRIEYHPYPTSTGRIDYAHSVLACELARAAVATVTLSALTPPARFYRARIIRNPDPRVRSERTVPTVRIDYPARHGFKSRAPEYFLLDLTSIGADESGTRLQRRGRVAEAAVEALLRVTRQSKLADLDPGKDNIFRSGGTEKNDARIVRELSEDRTAPRVPGTANALLQLVVPFASKILSEVTGGKKLPAVNVTLPSKPYTLTYGAYIGAGDILGI